MLTHLLELLSGKHDGMSLAEISREMQAQPSAVKAMLDLLVARGRVLEVGPDLKVCSTCGQEASCSLLAARGKRYMVCSPASLSLREIPLTLQVAQNP